MKALEVERWNTQSGRAGKPGRRYRAGSTWHWLNDLDPSRTRCGKLRIELAIVAEHDVEQLPPLEACRGCLRTVAEWAERRPAGAGGGVTADPRPGRVRKTGPLYHGTRRR